MPGSVGEFRRFGGDLFKALARASLTTETIRLTSLHLLSFGTARTPTWRTQKTWTTTTDSKPAEAAWMSSPSPLPGIPGAASRRRLRSLSYSWRAGWNRDGWPHVFVGDGFLMSRHTDMIEEAAGLVFEQDRSLLAPGLLDGRAGSVVHDHAWRCTQRDAESALQESCMRSSKNPFGNQGRIAAKRGMFGTLKTPRIGHGDCATSEREKPCAGLRGNAEMSSQIE